MHLFERGKAMRTGLLVAAAMFGLWPAKVAARQTALVYIISDDFVDPTTFQHTDPTIHVGDTVTWQWVNGLHSTKSAAGQLDSWDSQVQFATTPPNPPVTFSHTFLIPGTFNYYCQVHGSDAGGGQVAGMSGFIDVVPVPEPSTLLFTGAAAVAGLARFRRMRRS
jgi:plastocyanin